MSRKVGKHLQVAREDRPTELQERKVESGEENREKELQEGLQRREQGCQLGEEQPRWEKQRRCPIFRLASRPSRHWNHRQ